MPIFFFFRYRTELYLLVLYVHDFRIASSKNRGIEEIKIFLKKTYEMKDSCPINKVLGINIKQSYNTISISSSDYIQKEIKEHNNIDTYSNLIVDTNI